MSDTFASLEELQQNDGSQAALDQLATVMAEEENYHRLFDVLLMQKKLELGLPLIRPTSFDDVPDDQRSGFEKHYVESARHVGGLLLESGRVADAWVYFQTIQEPGPVREALDKVSASDEDYERTEELINVALYEGAHPVKGLELMLNSHGTCNTITALDQQIMQLPPEDRRASAQLLVKQLYGDLCHTLNSEVTQRLPMIEPSENLRELISGDREWLFAEGNYHIDVSHLSSVVRFARSLENDSPELAQALELAEYGARLDQQFQYPGEAPFGDFYTAHGHFLRALLDDGRDEAITYFQGQLETEPDEEDKQLIAYVVVDLLKRIGRMDEAIDLAVTHLAHLDESTGFSFAEFCQVAGRLDLLRDSARDRGDLVTWAGALIGDTGGDTAGDGNAEAAAD